MTTVTRVGFCENCFKANRPKKNQAFLAMGSSSGKLIALRAIRNGKRGFVPHLYLLSACCEGKYYFHSLCSVCGSYSTTEEGKNYLVLDETKWTSRKEITLNNWNALQQFKDTGFEI